MFPNRRLRLALVVCALGTLIVVVGYAVVRLRRSAGPRAVDQNALNHGPEKRRPADPRLSADPPPPHPGWLRVGGVWRPPTDVNARSADRAVVQVPAAGADSVWLNPGRAPRVALDANPDVQSVARALAEHKHPERLTAFARPVSFDLRKFNTDPDAYLHTVEPGRVFQSAEPAPGVTRIVRLTRRYQTVLQGQTVTLRVRAAAGAPVSFHSTRLGQFPNQLTAVTVRANPRGIAETQFTATPGTRGDIDILAASPVNSYQARFVLRVQLPEGPPKVTPQP